MIASARGAIDLDVAQGEVVLLRGPNGSGKTSLLRALAGLENPLDITATAPRVGLSPQDARDALAGLTVGGEFRLRSRRAPDALDPFADRESALLSSGESRRVALALADGAPLLLLDEPAEGLDPEGRARLRELVREAQRRGAVVAADHGEALADLATRVVMLCDVTAAALPPIPRAQGPIRLDAPPLRERGLALPALRLGPGFHALRGPNGSGKSTLLLAAARATGARLLLPHARDMLLRESVEEELRGCAEARASASRLQTGGCAEDARSLVPDALLGRHPIALSGGEAQRVALAKVLGRDASCYLLDEPEAHLDVAGRVALARLIAARVEAGACVLAATHDEALAALAQSEVRL
ncbi:MAG: energy-coupling factor transport system ATP-binding protein [Thermoplasmata archaeon]|jgi:ABC-type Mn2+/Zn2+ transport system ATPase subunit|nr:energy-coupling factor transport system ATP-binding protein [Thermoplasmata archaeon]